MSKIELTCNDCKSIFRGKAIGALPRPFTPEYGRDKDGDLFMRLGCICTQNKYELQYVHPSLKGLVCASVDSGYHATIRLWTPFRTTETHLILKSRSGEEAKYHKVGGRGVGKGSGWIEKGELDIALRLLEEKKT